MISYLCIKTLRKERAWSQAQLAEIALISIITVQRVEIDGKCSHDSLLALASAFDIDVKELTALLNNNENAKAKLFFSLFNSNIFYICLYIKI